MKLSDRIKEFERQHETTVDTNKYLVVRLDGRNFHTYTKKMDFKKPFDYIMIETMSYTTQYLMQNCGADIGYTQSDEITLVFHPSHIDFNGRVQKLVSTLASMCTIVFNRRMDFLTKDRDICKYIKHNNAMPTFDAMVISVDLEYVLLHLLWREQDAIRNSVNAMAYANFNKSAIHGLNQEQLKQKLRDNGTPWEELPLFQQRGIYFYKQLHEYNLRYVKDQIPPHVEYNPDEIFTRRDLVMPTDFYSIKELLDSNTEDELQEYFFSGID